MLELSYFCQLPLTISFYVLNETTRLSFFSSFFFFFFFLNETFFQHQFLFSIRIYFLLIQLKRDCATPTCLRFMNFDHLLRRVTSFTRNMLSCYRIWSIIEVSILNGVRIFVHTHGHYTRKIILHSSIAFDLTGVRATSSTIRHEPNR